MTPHDDDAALEDAAAALVQRHMHLLPVFADEFPSLPAASWPALGQEALADRARGCLLGLALGEALARDIPGEWAAATEMALCLAESLQRAPGGLDQYDFALRLRAWAERASLAIGPDEETRQALQRFADTDEPAAGIESDGPGGSAALTRVAPVAIACAADPDLARLLVQKQARATHGGREGLDACELFVLQLIDALNGADAQQALRPRVMTLVPRVLAVNGGDWQRKSAEQLRAGPEVVDTLEAALWAVAHTSSFQDALRAARGIGGDSLGVCAVAGQLAGALYGASGLPAEALAGLVGQERLQALADGLHGRT